MHGAEKRVPSRRHAEIAKKAARLAGNRCIFTMVRPFDKRVWDFGVLAVATLFHLEAEKIDLKKPGKMRFGKRRWRGFAKATRNNWKVSSRLTKIGATQSRQLKLRSQSPRPIARKTPLD